MEIGDALDPNSSAAILVWEDLWAKRFADAVADSGGVLVDIQRIPRDVVQAAIDYNGRRTRLRLADAKEVPHR